MGVAQKQLSAKCARKFGAVLEPSNLAGSIPLKSLQVAQSGEQYHEIWCQFVPEFGKKIRAAKTSVAIALIAASMNCTIVSKLQRTNQICPFFLSQ